MLLLTWFCPIFNSTTLDSSVSMHGISPLASTSELPVLLSSFQVLGAKRPSFVPIEPPFLLPRAARHVDGAVDAPKIADAQGLAMARD